MWIVLSAYLFVDFFFNSVFVFTIYIMKISSGPVYIFLKAMIEINKDKFFMTVLLQT